MKKVLVPLMMCIAVAAARPPVVGTWKGTLRVGAVKLHLILHVKRQASGLLTGSLDSVDQGAMGIPITSMALKGTDFQFTSDSIHGSYEGTVSADGTSIKGTWTQGRALPLRFHRMAKALAMVKPSDIDGSWQGAIELPERKLEVTDHIFTTALGLRATMDVPDQGAMGVPFTSVKRQGDHLTLIAAQLGAEFDGTINAARSEISGTWTQGGGTFPLVLRREAAKPAPPQAPKGPKPYRQKQVRFENRAAGIELAGTLTVPDGKGPFPAVELIAGSGPNDRDESVFGHKPFLVLADSLSRHGIAVLRYDKRGVGESGGSEMNATTADFASDAAAGFDFLRRQADINPREVGLIGHSEGGEIAPMVAARDPHVAFVVLMAAPGVDGERLLVEQVAAIARAQGLPAARVAARAEQERRLLALVAGQPAGAKLDAALRRQLESDHIPAARIGASVATLTSPWMRFFLACNPATTLRQLRCPVLALNGSLDVQVPARTNLAAIRQALRAGGDRQVEVKELAGLNHLFQPAHTGLVSEYATIPTTIAPVALRTIASWIRQQAGY